MSEKKGRKWKKWSFKELEAITQIENKGKKVIASDVKIIIHKERKVLLSVG